MGPQTYIVAQNPEVLAHLMRENENRIVNPSAYTTPASVFNTIAVDFDQQECSPEMPILKTCSIPVQSLQELNPLPPASSDETSLQESTTEIPPLDSPNSTVDGGEFIQNSIPSPDLPRAVPELSRVISEPVYVQNPIVAEQARSQPVVEGIYDFGGANVKSCAFMKGAPAFVQMSNAVTEMLPAQQMQVGGLLVLCCLLVPLFNVQDSLYCMFRRNGSTHCRW